MRIPIYTTIENNFDKVYTTWNNYKAGALPLADLATTLNDITGASHSMEHWHRTLTAVDIGVNRNADISEILSAKKQMSIENIKMNKHIKQLAFYDITKESIKECLTSVDTIKYDKMITPNLVLSDDEKVCIISDIHYQGYDKDLHNMFDSMLHTDYTTIVFNGDIIQGYLRESDLYNPLSSPIEQIQGFISIATPYLEHMFYLKKVVIIPGNHDEHRLMKQIVGDINKSFDELLAFMLQLLLPKIEVVYVNEFKVTYRDTEWLVVHGNGHRGEKALRDYYKTGNVMYGHYHNFKLDDIFISLPPACRSNSYEKFLGIPYSETAGYVEVNNDSIVYHCFRVGDYENQIESN